MEPGPDDALDEVRVVAAACAILRAQGDAKTRELVKHLAKSGIQIDKSRLNQILYRHVRTTPGLSVSDHTWHFDQPATPPNSAGAPCLEAQLSPPPRASDSNSCIAVQPVLMERGVSLAVPPLMPTRFELSPEQCAIVDAEPGRWLLVEAGPGTGKTAVALARVATLLGRGVAPTTLLMLSFTRTAIAELRQRIETLAKDGEAVAGVRITTLDAEAWNLGVGFQGGRTTEKLARGFDGNIEDAIALFRSNDPALCDWVAQTRHVIIDEAQDLVGRRSELVFQLLEHLSNECGVTVFVDPAQAIYGFAEDGDEDHREGHVPAAPFHQLLTKNFPGQFEACRLTRLYRSSNPTLGRIFADGRAMVLGIEPASQRLERLRDLAHSGCASTPSVADRPSFADDELVLFRRRSEVLLASSFLAGRHVPHRIRMGQTSIGTQAWLACLFGNEPANVVDRREFGLRWDLAAGHSHLRGLDRDRTWKLLGRLAGTTDGNAIDVRSLRRLLARTRPPAELCQTEVGVAGPIIGTIHGSKGREANTVSLMLSKVDDGVSSVPLEEEVRVTYVGSTRARQELLVGKGYVGFGFKALGNSGRVYRPRSAKGEGPGRVQVELGRPGDVDELSVVSRARWTAAEVKRSQAFLEGYAGAVVSVLVTAADDHTYLLTTEDGIPLGAFSHAVNNDLFKIAAAIDERTPRKPPKSIRFVSMIGVRTSAVADDHLRIAELHEPWATTGIFLVPVIRGLPIAYLPARTWRGNR